MIKRNRNLSKIHCYTPSSRDEFVDVTKLDWNECNLKFNEEYLSNLKNALLNINLSEYPTINNTNLMSKLGYYCSIPSENIQIFNGSDSALHYIFASFLNSESKVLMYTPNYTQIESYINLYSDNLNYSQIEDIFNEHSYNFNEIENNDVVYFSNPNNPTGRFLSPCIIEELLQQYPDKLFIIDEAYYEFCGQTCVSFVLNYTNIIILRTFSKAFSLASVRMGYICASTDIITDINKIRNSKEVNSFAQCLAEAALDNLKYTKARVNTIVDNRTYFTSDLYKHNILVSPSFTNFVLIKVRDARALIESLKLKKILIRDRSMLKGLENCVRVTIGDFDDMNIILKEIIYNENR